MSVDTVKDNIGSYKYKNVDIIFSVMITYFWIKFVDMPLFLL
jgi:hypothetical protein